MHSYATQPFDPISLVVGHDVAPLKKNKKSLSAFSESSNDTYSRRKSSRKPQSMTAIYLWIAWWYKLGKLEKDELHEGFQYLNVHMLFTGLEVRIGKYFLRSKKRAVEGFLTEGIIFLYTPT